MNLGCYGRLEMGPVSGGPGPSTFCLNRYTLKAAVTGLINEAFRMRYSKRFYVLSVCIPGFLFGKAGPDQSWSPSRPNLRSVLRALVAMLRNNRSIDEVVLYTPAPFNDVIHKFIQANPILDVYQDYLDINLYTSKMIQSASITQALVHIVEVPLSVFHPVIMEYMDQIHDTAYQLQKSMIAKILYSGPLKLGEDQLHFSDSEGVYYGTMLAARVFAESF